MTFSFTARADARALSVAMLGVGLIGAGLFGAWTTGDQARRERSPAPAATRVAIAPQAIASAAAVRELAQPPVAALQRHDPSAKMQPAVSSSESAPQLIRAADSRPTAAMSPFQLAAPIAGAQSRALDCLTTAVYYEARGEGTDGMAAVAQVVLNRVRHPAFPKSVCGVVFQGCQFSFACGGMNGRRNAALWSRSREIAEAALEGAVMARVGTATHFHATRISPRWNGLSRVATIGRHVFYSFAGRRGAPSTFLAGGGAGEAPRRLAPAHPETPVYAMLPSERIDAPAPSMTAEPLQAPTAPAVPTVSAAVETPLAPEPSTPNATPLPNAPVVTPDPMAASSPVA